MVNTLVTSVTNGPIIEFQILFYFWYEIKEKWTNVQFVPNNVFHLEDIVDIQVTEHHYWYLIEAIDKPIL